jgi:hypothetical protein
MPKCGLAVDRLGKTLGKLVSLSSKSTAFVKYLTSQVFFINGFLTIFEQLAGSFTQPFLTIFKPLTVFFSPLSTRSINNTNLIKEIFV